MARDCLLIRATNRGQAEMELARGLRSYFGRHIYFVLDRYSDSDVDVIMSADADIFVGGKFLRDNNIPHFRRIGWQCGDLCLYAAVQKVPYYDQYWMIEPDVSITLDEPGEFFKNLSQRPDDFIGSNFGKRGVKWWWFKTMTPIFGNSIFGSCFPISRFSFRAVQYLSELRKEYFLNPAVTSAIEKGETRLVANDESFVATTLANGEFSCSSLALLYPDTMSHFSATNPIHVDEIPFLNQKILHPVCDDSRFVRKFSTVQKNNTALAASRMEEFITHLGEESWDRATSISPADLRSETAVG